MLLGTAAAFEGPTLALLGFYNWNKTKMRGKCANIGAKFALLFAAAAIYKANLMADVIVAARGGRG